ncbi:GNAT family N-acetyltransferase [Chryseolinea sp. T2]|uniref:GNAT family N-acetyltransferase n=1 Tax=Chryseolinea sp. T2 TaxID=3129255 RepID=UPI003076963F
MTVIDTQDRHVEYTSATSHQHLQGILELQQRNLAKNLGDHEVLSQGFVTVQHSMEDLQKMNSIERHVIAVHNDRVVAYLLAMTRASRHDIPILVPMFNVIDSIVHNNKPLAVSTYIVVGQACVDKTFRGTGIFDRIYEHYAQTFKSRYEYIITEIDAKNTRSLRAHSRVGFRTVREYVAPNGVTWHIVLRDFAS